jgi:hypothetical protein
MSTILKALKRLEHDKQAEAARNLTHDPLAPALNAPDEPASRRSLAGPIALAAAAAIIGAGLSYGLASWWFSQGQHAGAPDVAAGSAPAHPLAAIPPAARASAGTEASGRSVAAPAGGVEPVGSAAVSSPVRAGGTPEPAAVVAQARPPSPDPWEEMARAAASDEDSAADEKDATPSGDEGASSTASSNASKPASSGSRAASSPRVAQRRAETAPSGAAATTSNGSSARTASQGARPVSSLPEVSLPEPVAAPPPVTPAKKPAPAPEPATRPAAPVEPTRPEPVVAAVQVEQPGTRIEVFVVKTVWHPKPERRSARLRLSDRVDTVEVREEDVVEGYVVREITPSSVVLARGDVVVTHRVGR